MLPPVNPPRHLSEEISTKLGPYTSLHSRSVQARAMLTSTRQIPAAIANFAPAILPGGGRGNRLAPEAPGTQSAWDDRTREPIPIPDDVARSVLPWELL